MPKSKANTNNESEVEKEEIKETLIDDEEKDIDPELIAGDLEDDIDDDLGGLDDDEVDPFKDKWEE